MLNDMRCQTHVTVFESPDKSHTLLIYGTSDVHVQLHALHYIHLFCFITSDDVLLFKANDWMNWSLRSLLLVWIIIDGPIFGQNTVFRAVCLFVYSHLISSVKNIGSPVEQCQMALWVFLMAYWLWLVFAIQLLLKNQCFFFSFFSWCAFPCIMVI